MRSTVLSGSTRISSMLRLLVVNLNSHTSGSTIGSLDCQVAQSAFRPKLTGMLLLIINQYLRLVCCVLDR